ncbi:DNA repair protein RadA [Iocasia frigidifontis]|uniref:DNA repair protein RadA n=1 Tax=Iocasia fonsfrigidae TaxID=2682810 RepID=A0A8A7KIC7_9FIRM|nr:DNA repair protein RadA [Iocasia fonsfrigidae]QTL99329.1 DNA repair protein RadA [Iocasia fonsfrigidae]
MARDRVDYTCEECGYKSSKWMGRCPNCDTWNSFVERRANKGSGKQVQLRVEPSPITKIEAGVRARSSSGIGELDRVLGGGIVSGSLVLLGGAPGIGKSTLILQAASLFSKTNGQVLYVSGEESATQIKLRAERLKAINNSLYILAETEFDQISVALHKGNYDLVIIDSIQTVYEPKLDSAPGSIPQVKEITNQLMKIAKTKNIPIFLIGHVTKEGNLAGPRVMEHLVDAVLQFEGDRNYSYRILRAVKNRYGSTNEVGVFEMKGSGMEEVLNPSQLFLEERPDGVSGSVIAPVIEGSRPLLIEVQSLVSSSTFSAPQRLTTGVDYKRVSILLAVLEKKAGFNFQTKDVHINITGGFKVDEPALDLGIISAIISSYQDQVIPDGLAVIGEVGLAGEVRAVSQIEQRIKEAKKLGFNRIIIPQGNFKGLNFDPEVNIVGIVNIHQLLQHISKVG